MDNDLGRDPQNDLSKYNYGYFFNKSKPNRFDETENSYTYPHPDPNNLFSMSPSTAHLPVDIYNTIENAQMNFKSNRVYKGRALGGGFQVSGSAYQIQDDLTD